MRLTTGVVLGGLPFLVLLLAYNAAVMGNPLAFPFDTNGGLDPAGAARAGLDLGPTRVLMAGQPDDLRAEVAAAIAEVYEDHTDEHGHVTVGGTFLVTTATR